MRVAALFSGGKDSTYATYVAMQRGWDVTHLLSVLPEDHDSMLFHTPNLHLTHLQAEAMRIPLVRETAAMVWRGWPMPSVLQSPAANMSGASYRSAT